MSKISEKKAEMGYRTTLDCCATCAHYSSREEPVSVDTWSGVYSYKQEKQIRCALGKFKTRKTAVCNHFKQKGEL